MLTMNIYNILAILLGIKTMTLRPTKKDNKGYFKVGSDQQIKINRFHKGYLFKVKITGREIINIDQLSKESFKMLGYQDKEEYLKEAFNQGNGSKERILYKFEIIPSTINWNLINALNWKC